MIAIEFTNKDRTRATVTVTPTWLGRLFRRRTRITRVANVHEDNNPYCRMIWVYSVDGIRVSLRLEHKLDQARRWDVQQEIPSARLLS